jgi:uncharacterized membrane protein YqjE
MHTRATRNGRNGDTAGLGAAVKQVTERMSALVRLELELASLELKRKIGALGAGIGLAVGAALFGALGVGFLFATVAAALATFLATWLALLVVTVFLFLLAAVLGLVGVRSIKKGTPPVPEQAIREAKLTTTALKGD